jgi:hypothetical protein
MTGYKSHPEAATELQEAARYYSAMSATHLPDAGLAPPLARAPVLKWPPNARRDAGTNPAIADSSQARAVRRSGCEYVAGTSTASNLEFDAQMILRIADARSP